jgi:hypothetical protein
MTEAGNAPTTFNDPRAGGLLHHANPPEQAFVTKRPLHYEAKV